MSRAQRGKVSRRIRGRRVPVKADTDNLLGGSAVSLSSAARGLHQPKSERLSGLASTLGMIYKLAAAQLKVTAGASPATNALNRIIGALNSECMLQVVQAATLDMHSQYAEVAELSLIVTMALVETVDRKRDALYEPEKCRIHDIACNARALLGDFLADYQVGDMMHQMRKARELAASLHESFACIWSDPALLLPDEATIDDLVVGTLYLTVTKQLHIGASGCENMALIQSLMLYAQPSLHSAHPRLNQKNPLASSPWIVVAGRAAVLMSVGCKTTEQLTPKENRLKTELQLFCQEQVPGLSAVSQAMSAAYKEGCNPLPQQRTHHRGRRISWTPALRASVSSSAVRAAEVESKQRATTETLPVRTSVSI